MTLKQKILDAIGVSANDGQSDLDLATVEAALDDLVESARRVVDEPSEDATVALDAALAPWEDEGAEDSAT